MPPTSRGILLLRFSHRTPPPRLRFPRPRRASFKPFKIPGYSPKPKPRHPAPTASSADPLPRLPKPSHWSRLLFASLRRSEVLRTVLHILPWLPIIAVAIHHSPITHYTVEGPSMKPTFNPNHNSEAGTLNTETHVLILKHSYADTSIWNYVSNLFARNNYRRKSHLPQRGQVVAYRTPFNPERIGTKRVVGLPGDRVTPLEGYPGGHDPVIIPWNHLWLEGDIEDREYSLDSNHFGPVSANLVIGTVELILPWFAPLHRKDATYPAQSRVEPNVVPQHNPDEEVRRNAFIDGRATEDLKVVKAYPLDRPLTPQERYQFMTLRNAAAKEKAKKDTQTYELATALEAELIQKLTVKAEKETLKNVSLTPEELAAFQKDGAVPESVLARSRIQ